MHKASGPLPSRTFRDKYLAVIWVAALLVCSSITNAQTIQYPNPGLYGQGLHRNDVDSTLYFPTGCGAPSGISGLRSYGFNGFGQKVRRAAIYADTCGHHVYWFHWPDSTWRQIDGGSGSGPDSLFGRDDITAHENRSFNASLHDFLIDSARTFSLNSISHDTAAVISANAASAQMITSMSDLSNFSATYHRPESIQMLSPVIAINTPLAILSDYGSSGTHFGTTFHRLGVNTGGDIIWDTASTGGGATDTTSLSNRINLKKDKSDSTASTGYLPVHRLADTSAVLRSLIPAAFDTATSQGGAIHTQPYNDVRYLKRTDSTAQTGYVTHYQKDTADGNLRTSIAGKVANLAASTGIRAGAYLSRPSASNCLCYYWSTDSAFWSYDNGTWKDLKPGTGGGGSQTFPQVLATGRTLSADDSIELAGKTLYHKGGMTKVDSLRSAQLSTKYAADSNLNTGTSITAASLGTSDVYHRFSKLVANKFNVAEANYGISGGTLVTQGFNQLPSLPIYTRSKYNYWIIEWGPNDIQLSSTPDSTTFAGKVSDYLDSLITNHQAPASKILWVAPGYIDSTVYPNATTIRQRQFKNAILTVAASKSVKAFSMYDIEVARDWKIYLSDGLHPNDAGHALYAWAIEKALTDSVPRNGQAVAINGLVELQNIKIRNGDTAGARAQVVGTDSLGNVVRFAADDIPVNASLRKQPQGLNMNIWGWGIFGNTAGATIPSSVKLYTPGTIQGGSMRITSGPPSGWSGDAMNFSYSSNVGHIFGYTYPSGPSRGLAFNELGSPVMIGTATATGGPESLQVNGGSSAQWGVFTSNLSATGATGKRVEIYFNTALNAATLVGYDRTAGAGLDMLLNAGLGGKVLIGSTSFSGSLPFQVVGSQYISSKLGLGINAPTAVLHIKSAISTPTNGNRVGVYISSDTNTVTYNLDYAAHIDHFFGRKTIVEQSVKTIQNVYNTVIEKDSAGANATLVRNRSLLVHGPVVMWDSVLLGKVPDGNSSDSVLVIRSGDSTVRKVAQSSIAGTSNPFSDASALVKNSSDATKLLKLSAASVTTGTTRTWTFPDVNGTVARNDAAQTFTGDQTFSNDIVLSSPSGAGSNDSAVTWDPVTKKLKVSGRVFNFTAKNGNRLRSSDSAVVRGGALDEDTYTQGGGFSIYEGTSGSNLDSFAVYASNKIYFNKIPVVNGSPLVVAYAGTDQTGSTTDQLSGTTCPADGIYEASGYLLINSLSSSSVKLQVQFNDHNNTTQTIDLIANGQTVAANASTGYYVYATVCFKAKAGEGIGMNAIKGAGAVNYDWGWTIKQLR